jgi:hypothetical protein
VRSARGLCLGRRSTLLRAREGGPQWERDKHPARTGHRAKLNHGVLRCRRLVHPFLWYPVESIPEGLLDSPRGIRLSNAGPHETIVCRSSRRCRPEGRAVACRNAPRLASTALPVCHGNDQPLPALNRQRHRRAAHQRNGALPPGRERLLAARDRERPALRASAGAGARVVAAGWREGQRGGATGGGIGDRLPSRDAHRCAKGGVGERWRVGGAERRTTAPPPNCTAPARPGTPPYSRRARTRSSGLRSAPSREPARPCRPSE